MKRYLDRQRKKKKMRTTWLELGMLKEGSPALFCNGALIRNVYTAEVRHNSQGRFDSVIHVELPMTMQGHFVVDYGWKTR